MDQTPHSTTGYNNLFADSQQYHTYDHSFLNGDSTLPDAGWGINASTSFLDPHSSRAQPSLPSWQTNANQQLSTSPAQGNPYSRSLSHSPAPFGQNNLSSYAPPSNVHYQPQPQYDPSLFSTGAPGQSFNHTYGNYGNQNLTTIAPQALQHEARSPAGNGSPYAGVNYGQNNSGQPRNGNSAPIPQVVNQRALMSSIPASIDDGYMSTINFDQMGRATNSERMAAFLSVGKDAQEWPMNRTTAIPPYVVRKSKNELRKLAGNDSVLLAKIGKKSFKKLARSPHFANGKVVVTGPEQLKYEGDSSSSEESSDDNSLYTSDEDTEPSPLPSKRPITPREGAEYDTIRALWRPKRRNLAGKDIRQALGDYWEIIKTIRDRWKTDSAAVVEAEKKGQTGELPLLGSRVKDQRDMVEVSLKAALKHGHRDIVELFSENAGFVFLCYQFLLDRHKVDELNGPLARTILELMSLFTTTTDELLEKTHLDKVLPRYVKKGDAKTQYFAKRVLANSAAATMKKAAASPVDKQPVVAKHAKAASPQPKRVEAVPVAGVKRAASNAGEGNMAKKVATGPTKPQGTTSAGKPGVAIKKSTSSSEPARPAVTVTKAKQIVAKPATSFFSGLTASKKPGTSIKSGTPAQATGSRVSEKKAPISTVPKFSFAQTMANISNKSKDEKTTAVKPEKQLPPETAEQTAKRLRKEARRKLHVAFRVGDELEQIRYFTHDPDEEEGHDDSQMRDVSDVAGEGRMLKMHAADMDVEEEEEEIEQPLVNFHPPSLINFGDVDPEERNRNYSQRGGGKLQLESPERAVREQYEADVLIVVYADVEDIPPNPREPSDIGGQSEQQGEMKYLGQPEQRFAERARHRKGVQQQWSQPTAPAQPTLFNLANVGPYVGMQQQAPMQPQASLDLTKLLATLQPALQPQQAASAMTMYQPPPSALQPTTAQNLDISAILAAINPGGQAGQAGQMVMPAGFMPTQALGEMGEMGEMVDGRWRDKGEKNKFYKTKVCKYWQEGRCMKGEGCTYLHYEVD
ncbi:hypothetical protein LTR62_006726 [Meristemomyces frigidus]|uniref:C3H1-type domain-containing protein n=1 Tax=Meristemomyces frigidus TaxID=1508187 RepID=A0AAN7YRX7_9PEZI|nr:hypothetical protein LTR62_006726 [Meristemomyces frigidus]